MDRLIGYICNDNTLTHRAVEQARSELDAGEDDTDPRPSQLARGFGWIREGQALLRKQPPQGIQSGRFGNVLADIRGREIVGYECATESSHVETFDLQPFSFRTWLFAQVNISGLTDRRDAVLDEIPDHIRHNIDGNTDEELVFYRFLASLYDRGGFGLSTSEPEVCVQEWARSIRKLESQAADDDSDRPLELGNTTLASERFLLATRFDEPMHYRVFERLEEPTDEPLFAGHRPQGETHDHFRGVLVLNGFTPDADEWYEVPERSVLWVDNDWEPTIVSLEEALPSS